MGLWELLGGAWEQGLGTLRESSSEGQASSQDGGRASCSSSFPVPCMAGGTLLWGMGELYFGNPRIAFHSGAC